MIIEKSEWEKRTDNSSKAIVGKPEEFSMHRWGKDFNLKYLKNNGGEITIKGLEELEFPDGSVYKPSEKKMVHVLISVDKKPKTNRWDFELETKEKLAFMPQGELTPNEIKRKCERPSYIIDSIAVYKSGGQKLFHFPRAWAKDAKGDWTWGKLERKGNIITKIIPQEWLDQATYPIIVDTNVGYDSIGGTLVYTDANDIMCSHVISGRAGNITGITWYTSQYTDTYRECTFCVYESTTNLLVAEEAGGLLTTTAQVDAWVERTPDNPSASVALTEDQAIRVGMYSDLGFQRTFFDTSKLSQTVRINTPGTGTYVRGSCQADVSAASVGWTGFEIMSAYVVMTLTPAAGGATSHVF